MQKKITLCTACVTPFKASGEVDLQGFQQNLNQQLRYGVESILALGTTAETPTLIPEEKVDILQAARKTLSEEIHLMVGAGTNSTRGTIQESLRAAELGADSLLIVTPYYNKPNQEGIYQHFKAIVEAVDLPIFVYNIEGRTGKNIETKTLRRLSEMEQIVGVKEASGSISQIAEVIQEVKLHRPDFQVLCGDDLLALPAILGLGADGLISVTSNLLPAAMKSLVDLSLEGRAEDAQTLFSQLYPVFKTAFCDTNPTPIKEMMARCKMPAGPCRLPLTELSEDKIERIKTTLEDLCRKSPSASLALQES